ncbi:MAG: hypothetical protein ABIR19_05360 [Ginsengibacter sp.]
MYRINTCAAWQGTNERTAVAPGIFFLHYWGIGPAEKLAPALKRALYVKGNKP